jgi:hypothetical protein
VSGLSHVADIPAHSATISDVQFPFESLPQALYSCSRDGHVKAWDLRSRQLAERYAVTGNWKASPLSSSFSAQMAAAMAVFAKHCHKHMLHAFDEHFCAVAGC